MNLNPSLASSKLGKPPSPGPCWMPQCPRKYTGELGSPKYECISLVSSHTWQSETVFVFLIFERYLGTPEAFSFTVRRRVLAKSNHRKAKWRERAPANGGKRREPSTDDRQCKAYLKLFHTSSPILPDTVHFRRLTVVLVRVPDELLPKLGLPCAGDMKTAAARTNRID